MPRIIGAQFIRSKAKVLILASVLNIGLLVPAANVGATGGDASFALSPSSGSYAIGNTVSVQIKETSSSSDSVNAVQANLSYPTASLQYVSTSLNGPFTLVGQNSGGSGTVAIGIASTSTVSGTQNVAEVTFKVDASSGSAVLEMTGGTNGSNIDNSHGSSVWNGVLPKATYTLVATGGTSSSSSGSTSSGSTGSTSKSSTSSAAGTVANSTPSIQSSLSVAVTNSDNKPVVGANVTLSNGQSAKTNDYGVVSFPGITAGKYKVTVSDPGKKLLTSSVNLAAKQNKYVSYKLASNQVVSGSDIAIVVLIIVVLVIAFIIFRRVKLGLQPQLSSNNGNINGASDSQATTIKSPSETANDEPTSDDPRVISPDHKT